MTDKIQQARRAAFEKWANQHRMPIGRDGVVVDYSARETDACWQAFNAALDLALIKLPPAFDDVHNYACYQGGWNDMRGEAVDAIESTNLGIKVK